MTVIHNGVDTRRFSPDSHARDRVRAELGIGPSDFCIGCVGNLLPVKDHLTVLRALPDFDAAGRSWRLLLIGEGSERGKLEAHIEAHGQLKGRVCLMGSSSRVPEMLNALDVYILPSLAEGISNSLLEAMATGVPVIATATGGNPEVILDGKSGLLFPVSDCGKLAQRLKLLASDSGIRERLSQEAMRRIREYFSLDSMIHKYEHLYERLAAEG
jgi:glycosyltransferase involved in cell wall biosynthesis